MELVTSEALPAFPASVLPSCFWTFEPFPLHSAPLSLLLSAHQRAFFKHPICAIPRTTYIPQDRQPWYSCVQSCWALCYSVLLTQSGDVPHEPSG